MTSASVLPVLGTTTSLASMTPLTRSHNMATRHNVPHPRMSLAQPHGPLIQTQKAGYYTATVARPHQAQASTTVATIGCPQRVSITGATLECQVRTRCREKETIHSLESVMSGVAAVWRGILCEVVARRGDRHHRRTHSAQHLASTPSVHIFTVHGDKARSACGAQHFLRKAKNVRKPC